MKWADRARGYRVTRFRRRILERDKRRCATCGRAGRLEIHHRLEVSRGGAEFDPENAVTLCISCHLEKHQTPLGRERGKWRKLVKSRVGMVGN